MPRPSEPSPRADAYRAPTGTHDVLPPESAGWVDAVARFAERARRAGFGLLVTPVLEHVEVFLRVGEHTDVRKEMYEFEDKGGRAVALRPEGTAPVVRAYVQHRPTPPWKVWYLAPNFRYERPQKGRYRQHWQLGAEVLGVDDPDVDVEVIALAHDFYRHDLGLRRVTLTLNSMGDDESRSSYLAALEAHWARHVPSLGDDFAARARLNPLRVLDAKHPDWQEAIAGAPRLPDHLTDASRTAFERVGAGLAALGIAFELSPRLVRGFDYYTGTVFEFAADALDAAQDAVGGGGRYDRLAEDMGGPPTPGIGFGIGVERVLLACEAEGVGGPGAASRPDAFLVDAVGGTEALRTAASLRDAGLAVDRAYGGRSVKAQWKAADRSGARFGVMLGRDEAARGAVAVKDLATGEQVEVPGAELAGWLTGRRGEAR